MPNETQEEFLKDLEPKDDSVLDQPLALEAEPFEPPKDDVDKPNRRERRLQERLQAERESSISLAAKLEVLTEAQKFSRENNPEIDETIARIYGTNTPEAAEATALLQKALKGAEDRATERALDAYREEQAKERDAERQEERTLDDMVDDIEDTFSIVMDSNTQKGFFQLLEKLSPKDRDGNVIEYADHQAVWEEYQSRRKPENTRAKDLASRSVAPTGSSAPSTIADDATTRYLKEHDII